MTKKELQITLTIKITWIVEVYTCNIYSQMLTSLWCQHNQQMKYIINEYLHSYLKTNYIALVITSHYLSLNCNLGIIGMNNNVMQLEFNIEKKWDCINIESLLLNMVLKSKSKINKKIIFSCHSWEWAKQILLWNCLMDNLWNLKLSYLN